MSAIKPAGRNTIKNVGDKFDLRTAKIPLIDPVNGKLPTGGNAVVVPGTGSVPNNELAAKSPDYLRNFYKENPLFLTGLSQMDRMIPWYSFPRFERREGHPDHRREPLTHRRAEGRRQRSAG